MIQGHRLTTEPTAVRFAGSRWQLTFDLWAIAKLGQRYAPDEIGLDWLRGLMVKAAAGDIDALCGFLWAGLLRESPELTFDDVLTLLDEASMADLVALPNQVLGALREAFGESDSSTGGGGPWDWEMALATWVKEWGRGESEFWATTFRTFTSISNGLSRIYERARRDHGNQVQAPPDGWSLVDLLSMRGR